MLFAIQSALDQHYDNLEVIVSDNASTDETQEVAAKFSSNAKVSYYRNDVDIGPVENFNQALMHYASGDFVLTLSDDDKITDPFYIQKAIQIIQKEPKIVLVFANYREVDLENHSTIKVSNMGNNSWIADGKDIWINYWRGVQCPLLTTLYSRKIAMNVGGYILDTIGADALLALNIMLHGKVVYINEVVADYGTHSGSATRTIRDIGTLYRDMDWIRAGGNYAIRKGLDAEQVSLWKKRLLGVLLREYVEDPCLLALRHGDAMPIKKLYELAQSYGELEVLFDAMTSNLLRTEKNNGKI